MPIVVDIRISDPFDEFQVRQSELSQWAGAPAERGYTEARLLEEGVKVLLKPAVERTVEDTRFEINQELGAPVSLQYARRTFIIEKLQEIFRIMPYVSINVPSQKNWLDRFGDFLDKAELAVELEEFRRRAHEKNLAAQSR